MTQYTIRPLRSGDFAALANLENDVFAAMGEAVLCPHRDFYGPGDERIVSRIDRRTFERMRNKYERRGFLPASNDVLAKAG
jgi:hypothetical protein